MNQANFLESKKVINPFFLQQMPDPVGTGGFAKLIFADFRAQKYKRNAKRMPFQKMDLVTQQKKKAGLNRLSYDLLG